MDTELTPADLLAFEETVANEFETGAIRSPVHLGGGNERQLIEIFKKIASHEWVLCGWRSHYHCLLKGVPKEELRAAIRNGRSVSLCFPRQRVLCSGIVGGIAPIAVGLAMAIKKHADASPIGGGTWVNCFVGDMSWESGIVHESVKYAARRGLLIRWIIEDNGKSVCTDTKESWGRLDWPPTVERYAYDLSRPHAGIGKWVKF